MEIKRKSRIKIRQKYKPKQLKIKLNRRKNLTNKKNRILKMKKIKIRW